MKPLVAIITVVYNGAATLERTIVSVKNQTYNNIEYFIVDGASNDGSIDIIKKYQDNISCWVSEKDNGIYDAMNKGIKLVKNDDSYILFLNADDYFASNSALETFLSKSDGQDYLYGKVLAKDEDLEVVIGTPLSMKRLPFGMLQHQANLTRKKVFSKLGVFDLSYKIAADYEFAVRVFASDTSICFTDEILSVMSMGGASSSEFHTTFSEKRKIILKYYGIIPVIKAIAKINLYEVPKNFLSRKLRKYKLLNYWRKVKFFIHRS